MIHRIEPYEYDDSIAWYFWPFLLFGFPIWYVYGLIFKTINMKKFIIIILLIVAVSVKGQKADTVLIYRPSDSLKLKNYTLNDFPAGSKMKIENGTVTTDTFPQPGYEPVISFGPTIKEHHFEYRLSDGKVVRPWSIEINTFTGDSTFILRDGTGEIKFQFIRPAGAHGWVILKDTRPGIPPLRMAIHCPYTGKDTIFILDSAAFYGKPRPRSVDNYGEYYMYGQEPCILGGGWTKVQIGGPDHDWFEHYLPFPGDTNKYFERGLETIRPGENIRPLSFEKGRHDGVINYRKGRTVIHRGSKKEGSMVWHGKAGYRFYWRSDGKTFMMEDDMVYVREDTFWRFTSGYVDSIPPDDRVNIQSEVKPKLLDQPPTTNTKKQSASGIWATVIVIAGLLVIMILLSLRKSNKNQIQ